MSLIYKKKCTGPNTDPCGAPYVMFDNEVLRFLINGEKTMKFFLGQRCAGLEQMLRIFSCR